MKTLVRYLKPYRLQAILAPLFKMLEATFELLVPLVMARLIDIGIADHDKAYVLKMGGMLLLLALVGLAASVTAQYFAAAASNGFGKELRRDFFRKIHTFSYGDLDRIGISTLVTRMTSDINQIQTGVNMLLRLFLRSPFIVFGAVIMAFTVDARTALVFAVVLPLLVFVVFGIIFSTIPMYRRVQDRLDRVTLLTRESQTGVRVIRAFRHQEADRENFHTAAGDLAAEQLHVGRISAVMNPVTYIIVNLGIAALIWFGGIRVNAGSLSQGSVVALVNYMSQILVELIKLANLIITTTKAFACASRIEDIMNQEPTMSFPEKADFKDTENPVERVAFSHVSMRYPGDREPAVRDVTFTAKPGDMIGVIGGTGAGKSSLVNLIPRFYDAEAGEVRVDGIPVQNYPKDMLRKKIGMVPQKAVLFRGSVRDNLKWGRHDASESDMWKALDISQSREFVEKKEGGLDYQLNQGGKNLSGGQRQRLTIARALVREPEILILDDSASALDFATDAALRKAIREKTAGMTVFIVSQRVSAVRGTDRIIVLDNGTVAGIGTHEELLSNCPVYQEIYKSQNREAEA